MFRVERKIGARTLSIETGAVAKQADGSVTVRCGDTIVMVAAVSAEPREGIDFFPLTIEYREKLFAAGKIPGGRFYKREGRPSIKEYLTMRLTDRPVRPLFPEGYCRDIQVTGAVFSADRQNDPDVLMVNGASAALSISGIPFLGPVGTVRLAHVDGQYILFPTADEREKSNLDLIFTAGKQGVVMIEANADQASEDVVFGGIVFAQDAINDLIAMQEELVNEVGKPAEVFEEVRADDEMVALVLERYGRAFEEKIQISDAMARRNALALLRESIGEEVAELRSDWAPEGIPLAAKAAERNVFRRLILNGQRCDGRGADEIRTIACEVGILPRTHGSALFNRGETQALVVTTLGTSIDEEIVTGLCDEYRRKFMLHYNHPGFSVGEVRPARGPSRRDVGHGALAEKSFVPILPKAEEFPYTIQIISEILGSNGSTSMASVCGATLALMDAGVPISDPVAGLSVGLVQDGDRSVILSDIVGDEDHHGDMDFKVAGTQHGITAIQLDVKNQGLTQAQVKAALDRAREGRMHILREMLKTISQPRSDISEHAPRLLQLHIPPEKIGSIIGPGGKMIRRIEEESGARVEVEDDGTVTLSAMAVEAAESAKAFIEGIVIGPKVGKIYTGRVVSIRDFGAFVEILPGVEGLVHISELAEGYVKHVDDVVKMGEEFPVKLTAIDDQKRLRLSRKAALKDAAEGAPSGPPDSAGGDG